jgi:hypothetical protein
MHDIPDDLSIPAFLIATGPGDRPHLKVHLVTLKDDRPPGIGPSCWEEMNKPEWIERREMKSALEQYEDEKRFAAFQQWVAENPELAAMNAKARRDSRRRIAKLGIPPAFRRVRR